MITLIHFFSVCLADETPAIISVEPSVTKSINGISELNRMKYFNLATEGTDFESVLGRTDRINYYLDDLGMSFGRSLGGVYSELRWGNSIQEDPARAGSLY